MSKDQFSAREVLAIRIRETRRLKQYSQEVLAEISGLNRSYIGAVERAEHNIGIDNIEKIAKGLGVPIAQLIAPSEPDEVSDVVQPPRVPAVEPVILETQFLELVKRSAGDRPDLLVIYLQRCGCRFVRSK